MKMAGYQNYSLSNNAVVAYENGLLPKSKANALAKALIKILSFKLQVEVDLKDFCVSDYEAEEWHHTSTKYNCTDFYDVFNIVSAEICYQLRWYEMHHFPLDPIERRKRVVFEDMVLEPFEEKLEKLKDLCIFDFQLKNKEIIEIALANLEKIDI